MDWKNGTYHWEGFEKHLARIHEKKAKLDALRPIPGIVLRRIKEGLYLEWTYHSNSIEGNSLTLLETKLVIKDGLTIRGKSLREHFEALNHHKAIDWIETLVSDTYVLNARDILTVHGLVLDKIEKEFAGRYRDMRVYIKGANFVPPNPLKVDDLMEELITWVTDEKNTLHTVVKATIFHHRFVWIHPFIDGNGRTVRLMFNLLLMKAGYPPAIILKADRSKYYDALNKANEGDYSKLLLLVFQALERSLDQYLYQLIIDTEEYQPISDIVSEPDFPYGQEYVSLLARQGKIDAFKEGRNWVTTKQAVLDYMDLRERKRAVN